nr:NADH dehydrogenase subunit 1 [Dromaeolus sp. ZM-2022]
MVFLSDLLILFFTILFMIIGVLVSVAFFTLLERKVLGYIQIRKGPNKVGFSGILQPFGDAIKLFSKEQTNPFMSNFIFYYITPVFSLFFSLVLWLCIPFLSGLLEFNFGVLFFLCISSLGVYSIMISGWSSNSNYSLIGGLRSVSQSISYEVSLSLVLFSFLILSSSLSLYEMIFSQMYVWFIFLGIFLGFMWFVSSLAETNRTPFDLAEGESELVSGFNIEYSSGGFALIFLGEYSSILFMSFLFTLIFMGGLISSLIFYFEFLFISILFLWVRGTLPRFRYDKLMYLTWKSFLPISLNFLFFYFGLNFFFQSLHI